jgi:hypothetical protein
MRVAFLLEPSKIIARARTYADFVMDRREQDAAGSVNREQTGEMTSEGFRKHRPAAIGADAVPHA